MSCLSSFLRPVETELAVYCCNHVRAGAPLGSVGAGGLLHPSRLDIQASPLQRVDWHCCGAVWHSWPGDRAALAPLVRVKMSQALSVCGLGWEPSPGHDGSPALCCSVLASSYLHLSSGRCAMAADKPCCWETCWMLLGGRINGERLCPSLCCGHLFSLFSCDPLLSTPINICLLHCALLLTWAPAPTAPGLHQPQGIW